MTLIIALLIGPTLSFLFVRNDVGYPWTTKAPSPPLVTQCLCFTRPGRATGCRTGSLGGGGDKWRMADRAASRGSQLAMSSNGFNTTTSNHSCASSFIPHCTHICSGDTIGGETLQLFIHTEWRFKWPTPHILGQAELVFHEKY